MRKERRYVPYRRLHRSHSLEIARAWNHPLQTWIHLHLPHPNTSLFAAKQMPQKIKIKIVLHSKRRKSRANKNKTQAKKKGSRQIDSGARKAHRNQENKHTSEKQSAEEPRGAPHEGREDEVQTTG